jgi:hypothetical protein
MEDVLVKGTFSGFNAQGYGFVEIEQVFNCMPPIHKYIYPINDNPEVKFPEKGLSEQ